MSAATETAAVAPRRQHPAAMGIGLFLAYVGFAALAASTVWTTHPLTRHGLFERYMLALLGVVLIGAAAIGRGRFAASMPGKLLCALGAGACLRIAVDPTLEALPGMADSVPMWILDAYPGLATVGWVVAALGALIWWLGGGAGNASPYGGLAVVSAVVLALVALSVRAALVAAGYQAEVPTWYETSLLIWRLVQVAAVLLVAMSLTGKKAVGPAPLVLFGLALLGHVAHTFLGGAPPQ